MLDHDDGVALISQVVQHRQQLSNVVKMQPGGRFVQNVERFAGIAFAEFSGQFDALGFTPRQRCGSLSKADVGQPHINQSLQFARNGRDCIKEIAGIFDGHFENFVDVLAFVGNFQSLPVVTLAPADITGNIDVRQEVHLHLDHTITLTGLAAAALDVEGESSGFVTAATGFLRAGKQLPHRGKNAGIGRRIRSRCATDRTLINVDNFVQMLQTFNVFIGGRVQRRSLVQSGRGYRVQSVVDQGGFTRPGDAGDTGEQSDRQAKGHSLKVVAGGSGQGQKFFVVPLNSLRRNGDGFFAGQIFPCQRGGRFLDCAQRSFRHDFAAVNSCSGTDIDDVIGTHDGLFIVLYHDHCIAEIAQMKQRVEQTGIIALMQAD